MGLVGGAGERRHGARRFGAARVARALPRISAALKHGQGLLPRLGRTLTNVLVGPEPAIPAALTMDELRRAQAEVTAIKVTDDTVDGLLAIRDACRGEGITASDRRWKKSLGVVRASAWLSGEKKTSPEDLAILIDSLWREPKERPKVSRLVGKLADPASTQSVEILDAAREIATKVGRLKFGDRKYYIAQAAQAVEQFEAQQAKLQKLAKSAGRRAKVAINEAVAEIQGLHAEMARAVSSGLGLRGLQ